MSIAITRRGKRQRRTPEEARRLILEAAQALIVTTGPEGLRLQDIAAAAGISHPLILRDIADRLHDRRIATAPPGAEITRGDTDALIHLIAAAAFGDALYGVQLRRSAGLPATSETDRSFRLWLAGLIRAHSARG